MKRTTSRDASVPSRASSMSVEDDLDNTSVREPRTLHGGATRAPSVAKRFLEVLTAKSARVERAFRAALKTADGEMSSVIRSVRAKSHDPAQVKAACASFAAALGTLHGKYPDLLDATQLRGKLIFRRLVTMDPDRLKTLDLSLDKYRATLQPGEATDPVIAHLALSVKAEILKNELTRIAKKNAGTLEDNAEIRELTNLHKLTNEIQKLRLGAQLASASTESGHTELKPLYGDKAGSIPGSRLTLGTLLAIKESVRKFAEARTKDALDMVAWALDKPPSKMKLKTLNDLKASMEWLIQEAGIVRNGKLDRLHQAVFVELDLIANSTQVELLDRKLQELDPNDAAPGKKARDIQELASTLIAKSIHRKDWTEKLPGTDYTLDDLWDIENVAIDTSNLARATEVARQKREARAAAKPAPIKEAPEPIKGGGRNSTDVPPQ